MSRETMAIVRQGIRAWNGRDLAALDRWFAHVTPDYQWIPASPAAVERAVYRGRDEIAAALSELWETWEEFHMEETELQDLGESVLWLGRVGARGRGSDVELENEFAIHFAFRAGKLARAEAFFSWRDGLVAAGLHPGD